MLAERPVESVRAFKSIRPSDLHLPRSFVCEPIIETRQSPARSLSTCSTVATTSCRNAGSPVFCISTVTAISSHTPAHFILTVEQNDNACKKPRLTQKIMKLFEGADPAMMATFWQAMHSLSILTARALGEAVDFGGFRKLLDVGGGSGAFDIELCRRYPNLSAMVYDLPF